MSRDYAAPKLFLSARKLALMAGVMTASLAAFARSVIGLFSIPELMLIAFILLCIVSTYARQIRS